MNEQTSEFLEQLMDRYRNCDTYQDTGIIQVDSLTGEHRSKSLYSFSTFFARPSRLSLSFWFTDDPNSSAINIVFVNGDVHAYREDSVASAIHTQSLNEALARISSICSLTTDGFVLAIPALLERELRDSSEANFFDAECQLVEQLNSKFHLRKSGDSSVTDIWFRPDLTVHDVEVCSDANNIVQKSRRVYSHVLFDLEIDDSVFEYPA